MKTAEAKAPAGNTRQNNPFFGREKRSDGDFFSKDAGTEHFFNARSDSFVQPKLTIGQPDDEYEKEADAMADKVMGGINASETEPTNVVETESFAQTAVQSKCAECEAEEKLQKKEDDDTERLKGKMQRKPIFESNSPRPEDEMQSKCTACDNDLSDQSAEARSQPLSGNTFPVDNEKEKKKTMAGPGVMSVSSEAVSDGESGLDERNEFSPQSNFMVSPGSLFVISQAFPVSATSFVPQIQLRADLSKAPNDLSCILMDVIGTPGALDIFFGQDQAALDPVDLGLIENFVGLWVGGGLSDDLIVSGYSSKEGSQRHNWRLSCQRAEAVHAELVRIGVPDDKISTFAHGETEDFDSTNLEPNRRATITTTAGTGPTITPVITPTDNFAGRSKARFGIAENMLLDYTAAPHIHAAEHFGVQWTSVSGAGTLISIPSFRFPLLPFIQIPGSYAAGNAPAVEQVALTVFTGPAAGFRLATANIPLVAPAFSYMVQVPGTGLCHTTGTASAGFRGNIFMLPTDVSFNNLRWREGNGTGIGFGSLRGLNGRVHPIGGFMTIANGNLATGCRVNTVDSVSTSTSTPNFSFLGITDWSGFFLWPIQWQFQAPGGPIVPYMTALHLCTIDAAGKASQSKAGAGPFSRVLSDPTTCVVGGLAAPHCC